MPINPNADEIPGQRAYATLEDAVAASRLRHRRRVPPPGAHARHRTQCCCDRCRRAVDATGRRQLGCGADRARGRPRCRDGSVARQSNTRRSRAPDQEPRDNHATPTRPITVHITACRRSIARMASAPVISSVPPLVRPPRHGRSAWRSPPIDRAHHAREWPTNAPGRKQHQCGACRPENDVDQHRIRTGVTRRAVDGPRAAAGALPGSPGRASPSSPGRSSLTAWTLPAREVRYGSGIGFHNSLDDLSQRRRVTDLARTELCDDRIDRLARLEMALVHLLGILVRDVTAARERGDAGQRTGSRDASRFGCDFSSRRAILE